MMLHRWVIAASSTGVLIMVAAAMDPGAFRRGTTTPQQLAGSAFAFDPHSITIGVAERMTVVTGFLLGSAMADLAVVHVDERARRRLRIFAFSDGEWRPHLDTTLGADVAFVDVANIDGRDRLITYGAGRVRWFDPASASERDLVAVTSSFEPPRKNEIPHVDITRDLNGDGRDDLVVPGRDGFRILVQTANGRFAEAVLVGPPARLSRIYGADGYRYDPWSASRIYRVDYNHDGRADLVFWSGDRFQVHAQSERGRFSSVPDTFTTRVRFDSDDRVWLAGGTMSGRVLHTVADMNGDGSADLVIHELSGDRGAGKQSRFDVHFGARAPDGHTTFAQEAGATFRTHDRVQLDLERHDFDGDGRDDVMLTTIERTYLEGSLWKRLKGFMGDDVWLELEFYRSAEGRFPAQPTAIRRIALDGTPSHREPGSVSLDILLRGPTHEARWTQREWLRAFKRNRFLGDVTGDGRFDLLVEVTFRGLDVFPGVAGSSLFAARPEDLSVILPANDEYTWLVDVNRDGAQDILLHHPFTARDAHGGPVQPPGTEPQRVVLLVAHGG